MSKTCLAPSFILLLPVTSAGLVTSPKKDAANTVVFAHCHGTCSSQNQKPATFPRVTGWEDLKDNAPSLHSTCYGFNRRWPGAPLNATRGCRIDLFQLAEESASTASSSLGTMFPAVMPKPCCAVIDHDYQEAVYIVLPGLLYPFKISLLPHKHPRLQSPKRPPSHEPSS